VNPFLSLVRGRLERQRDQAVMTRLREDAAYVAEAASGRLQLRHCDAVGAWARVVGRVRVENGGRIEIGSRTKLVGDYAPVELKTGPNGSIRIGGQGAINFGTVITATRSVTIGDRAAIGPYCIISDTELADPDGPTTVAAESVHIGDGVWLASRVTVMPGARIGDGAVITAGSVVAGEIPSRVVAGGSPARVLRYLDREASVTTAPIGVQLPDGPAQARAPGHANGTSIHDGAGTTGVHPNGAVAHAVDSRPEPAHRGLLVSDFTIDELARCLELDSGAPVLAAAMAPYGQVVPTMMSPRNAEHDYAVVWTRPQAVLPSFGRLLEFEEVEESVLLSEVDAFANLLVEGLKPYRFAFVPTWTVPPWQGGLGLVDARAHGVTRALCVANHRLMQRLDLASNVFVLNAQRWLDEAGRGAHSVKLWYMGKVPFSTAVFEHAARDIKAAVASLTGMARKLVIVDLDDTLWGGIVGDVGWENLRLGGHDSVGEAFVDFQHALKSLKRRGILLALVSKNDEAVALEAIANHGAMVLKQEDFVGWRINWQDKAKNVSDLVTSLNLGLQSTVFIDDNPFERARVREALPEVLVPDWPEDKLSYASSLLSLRCFDTVTRSAEDAARTEMYASDRKRDELRAQVGSLDEWLAGLGIRVRVEPLNASNLARTAQLLNKTNQMNLTTRRLTEPELLGWSREKDHWLWALSVRDRLGDAGLTGILSVQAEGTVARVVDFVLSCRVMGRRVEETMLHIAVDTARKHALEVVVADLLPTSKNKPCLEFWERSSFVRESPTRFTWKADREFPVPEAISLEQVS
jgi:FkbH-like protein